jgi:hypothetical protein
MSHKWYEMQVYRVTHGIAYIIYGCKICDFKIRFYPEEDQKVVDPTCLNSLSICNETCEDIIVRKIHES